MEKQDILGLALDQLQGMSMKIADKMINGLELEVWKF